MDMFYKILRLKYFAVENSSGNTVITRKTTEKVLNTNNSLFRINCYNKYNL